MQQHASRRLQRTSRVLTLEPIDQRSFGWESIEADEFWDDLKGALDPASRITSSERSSSRGVCRRARTRKRGRLGNVVAAPKWDDRVPIRPCTSGSPR